MMRSDFSLLGNGTFVETFWQWNVENGILKFAIFVNRLSFGRLWFISCNKLKGLSEKFIKALSSC